MKDLLNYIIKGTVLSVLIFFSISFLFVLYRISPITVGDTYSLEIGFPFSYYEQFQLRGNPFVNSGWNLKHLFLDCVITWVIVCGSYVLIKRRKAGNTVYRK
jgi:hypothetical protein